MSKERIYYPKIGSKSFYKKIRKIYKKYRIPKNKKNLKELCYPKKYKLQRPQRFVANYINPKTPYRDLLIFHQIGAGKTCASIQIGEAWKHKRRVLVVTPASLITNYKKELRSRCAKNEYLFSKERKMLSKLQPDSKDYIDIIKKSDQRIDRYYDIISYQKFISLSQENRLKLSDKVIIIDEVQNIVSEKGSSYKIFLKRLNRLPKSTPIILLSATPMFDKPLEIALTLNLMRLREKLPTGKRFYEVFFDKKISKDSITYLPKNLDYLKEASKGIVSYYRGADPITFPQKTVKYVDCVMSDFQYRSYISVLAKEGSFTRSDIFNMPNNFFIGSRSISNIAFPNKCCGKEGFTSFKEKYLKGKELKICSSKFYQIIKKVERSEGTSFIYSYFKEYAGMASLIKVLKAYGYKDVLKHGVGKKRYALWSGGVSNEKREMMKTMFNQKENMNGDLVKVFLGTPAIKEGVSLLRVRNVHILEPYWNISRMEQIIGRAIRYCSHKDVSKSKRVVKVFLYRSVHPEEITIDEYIYEIALKKNKMIKIFENTIKESSVDCVFNRNSHVIKCVK
jgi:superfamily II DNA or RNA helicase